MKGESIRIIDRLSAGGGALQSELMVLLALGAQEAGALYDAADNVRARSVGDAVHLRALIEFSNYCRCSCKYCGLRAERSNLQRYRMGVEEILAAVGDAAKLGYRTVVLQAGEDPCFETELLADIICRIKAKHDLAVTLSVGEKSEDEYRLLRQAGADRYLLRIETASPEFYKRLHPQADWSTRLRCLQMLREQSWQVGSGVIVGLPEQSLEMLAADLLFLQRQELDMVGIGPFIPHPDTPLGAGTPGEMELTLKFIACVRLLTPKALIPATTALGVLHSGAQARALRAGADVIMPDATPLCYRNAYEIYPGRATNELSPEACRRNAEQIVRAVGREVSSGRGDSRQIRSRVAGETVICGSGAE